MTAGIVAPQNTWTAARRKRDGKRFYYIPSDSSDAVYMTAVDGCTCPAAQNSKSGDCKHQGAVRRVIQPEPIRPVRARFEDLFPPTCQAKGCTDDAERDEMFCTRHMLADAF